MPANILIRPMAEVDLPAILGIQSECYTQVEPESEESLTAKLKASPETCFVAVSSDKVCGYLLSLPWCFRKLPGLNSKTCVLPHNAECLYLHDVAVSPAERKGGIGKALVEKFISLIEELNLKGACLIAVQASAPFWEKWGFRPAGTTPELNSKLAAYGPGAIYMERSHVPVSFTSIRGVIISEGNILLCRLTGSSILFPPGGRPQNSENHTECLLRELGEELGAASYEVHKYLGVIDHTWKAEGKDKRAIQHFYQIHTPDVRASVTPPDCTMDGITFTWVPVKELESYSVKPPSLSKLLNEYLLTGADGWSVSDIDT